MEIKTATVSMSLADWQATMHSAQEKDLRIESLCNQVGLLEDDLSELRDEIATLKLKKGK